MTPSQVNALKPGDVVSDVSGVIMLPPSDDVTFNMEDNLEFYTQLDRAKWSISIIINGVQNQPRTFTGNRASIPGMDLTYPLSNYEVKVMFSMEDGIVPASFSGGEIILMRARELDTQNNQVGSAVLQSGTVINPAVMQTRPTVLQTPTANAALDKDQADQAIQQTGAMIANVDSLIIELIANDGMKTNDPRLVPIINKRDTAVLSKSNALDLFTMGSYSTARDKATEGVNYANEAYTLSLALKAELAGNTLTTTSAPAVTNTPVSSVDSDLVAQLKRQNELLEEQNKKLAEQSNLLSQIISMFQHFFGIFGFSQPSQSQVTTPSPTTVPSPVTTVPVTSVTSTHSSTTIAQQTGTFSAFPLPSSRCSGDYCFLYEGAASGSYESSLATYIKININGIDQGAPSYQFPATVGAIYNFKRVALKPDHVIVTVFFSDGSSKIIQDTWV